MSNKTLPNFIDFSNYTTIFKLGFAKFTGETRTEVATALSGMRLVGDGVNLEFVVGEDDKIPVERKLVSADPEFPVRFFNNLARITESFDRALGHMSEAWRESVIMRILPALTKIEYDFLPILDQELVFAMHENLDEDQELEVLAFDSAETPRYQKDGFVVSDEVLVVLPLETGSDGLKHGVRLFPMLIVGTHIAFNQHYPVETLKYPRIEMNDPEYIPTRTGKVRWYSTGEALITEMPVYVDEKETVGRGIGASGVHYELSLAGAVPIHM